LPLAVLLLILWQIPLVSVIQRQAGTRALLEAIFRHGVTAAGPGRPVIAQLEPAAVQVAVEQLKQAQPQADTSRTLGLIALGTNDLSGAELWLKQRLARKPTDELAHYWLGETYLHLGDMPAAIEQWLAADAKASLLVLVGELRTQHGSATALEALQTIIARDPADVDARLLAMRLAAAESNTTQVLDRYHQIIRLEPQNITARQILAGFWLAQGNPDEALALAQEIIDVAPDRIDGYALGGDILFDQGHYESAATLYRAAVPYAGQNRAGLLLKVGRTQAAFDHWPEAIAAYEQALEVNPTSSRIPVLLAEAHCQTNRPDIAMGYYNQALNLVEHNEQVQQAVAFLAKNGRCPP
jgi:tetratricopeptide (TPR) repeat protein